MNKSRLLTCTLSAMLTAAASVGWTGTALAQEAAQTGAAAPATEWYPAQATIQATAAPTAPGSTAPAAAAPATQATAPAAVAPATAVPAAAAPAAAAPAAAAPAAAAPAAAAPATQATAPVSTQSATEESTTPDTTQDTRSYRGRYGSRRGHNRYAEQRKAFAKARHDDMERWRSMRRWWKNPAAEDRRMWNKARSRAHQDMAEARRSYQEQFRPTRDYGYGYGGRRSYRPDAWY